MSHKLPPPGLCFAEWSESIMSLRRPHGRAAYELVRLRQHALFFSCRTQAPIHIVGTSGKSTMASSLAASLSDQGPVIAFLSPHIYALRERFFDGKGFLEDDIILDIYNSIYEKIKLSSPGFFDVMFFIALNYAHQINALPIIEAGVGSALDVTMFHPKPKVIVVTAIGFDHCQTLGHHIHEIARDKLFAVRGATKAFILPQPLMEEETIRSLIPLSLDVSFLQEDVYEGTHLSTICRFILKKNIATRLHKLPGRLEMLMWRSQQWFFDMAHNPQKIQWLCAKLSSMNHKAFFVICGFQVQKDGAQCVEYLRAWSLCASLSVVNIPGRESFQSSQNVDLDAALHAACAYPGPVLITGSAFLLKPVRERLSCFV